MTALRGPGLPFLYHTSVLHRRSCAEILTKPLSSEKVVRPALVYSLFPNVPPTIYFGTRDERGNPGQGSEPQSAPRRRVLAKLGAVGRGVKGAFQNDLSGARFPAWFTSLILGTFPCLSLS